MLVPNLLNCRSCRKSKKTWLAGYGQRSDMWTNLGRYMKILGHIWSPSILLYLSDKQIKCCLLLLLLLMLRCRYSVFSWKSWRFDLNIWNCKHRWEIGQRWHGKTGLEFRQDARRGQCTAADFWWWKVEDLYEITNHQRNPFSKQMINRTIMQKYLGLVLTCPEQIVGMQRPSCQASCNTPFPHIICLPIVCPTKWCFVHVFADHFPSGSQPNSSCLVVERFLPGIAQPDRSLSALRTS